MLRSPAERERSRMITKPCVGVLLWACAGVAAAAPSGCLEVQQAWARYIPSNAMAAGYAVLANTCGQPVTVVGARSAAFGQVMLHESRVGDDGVSRMRHVDELLIPAHGRVELAPGGLHLMLMDARQPVMGGTLLPLVLQLKEGAEVEAEMAIKE